MSDPTVRESVGGDDSLGAVAGLLASGFLVVLSGVVLWETLRSGGAVGGAEVWGGVGTVGDAVAGRQKLLWIGWVAFISMGGAAWIGARVPRERARTLVWGYGLASGAMITSAAVFLLPQAIAQDATFGGFG
ncbi:MAG: hypothetical protein ABEI99_08950, partial [Halobaculum sp.]